MERMYAFNADSGDYDFHFGQEGVSTHFIITALIIPESKLSLAEARAEEIWRKYYSMEGMISPFESVNHQIRCNALEDL